MSKSACGIGLEQARTKHGKEGFFAIVTQKGCPPCPPMKRLLKKSVGGKRTIVELPVEDAKCQPALDRYRVTVSPTILFFKGKSVKRITEGDKTDDQIRAQIAAIVGKGKK